MGTSAVFGVRRAEELVMSERMLDFRYDSASSTLVVYGVVDHETLPRVLEAVDRGFRSSPCRLTVDLTGVDLVPARLLGWLVHLCNTQYPGTLIRATAHRSSSLPEVVSMKAIA